MKLLVTYYSDSGNTEKVAKAIYEAVDQAEKEIVPLAEAQNKDLSRYDLIFYGFPVNASSVPAKAQSFLKALPQGAKLALFSTHGSFRGGPLAVTGIYNAMSLAKQAMVLGSFCCQGKVKESILDALEKKPEHKQWVEEARSAVGHPDAHDLDEAKDFTRKMLRKARSY